MQIFQIKTIHKLICDWWRWLTGQKPMVLVCYWGNGFIIVHVFEGKPSIDAMWQELCGHLASDSELEDMLDWDDVLIALRKNRTDTMALCGVNMSIFESGESCGIVS